MAVAGTIDEACRAVDAQRPRLIVVHWSPGWRHEDLSPLLRATRVLSRPTPVVVVADWYRADQATQFRRMGVTDYISRSHHAHQFGRILDTDTGHRPTHRPPANPAADRRRRPCGSRIHSSRAVAAQPG